jgi:hypothetical protein
MLTQLGDNGRLASLPKPYFAKVRFSQVSFGFRCSGGQAGALGSAQRVDQQIERILTAAGIKIPT